MEPYQFSINCDNNIALKFIDHVFRPTVAVRPLLFAGDKFEEVYQNLKEISKIIDGNFFLWFIRDLPDHNDGSRTFVFAYASRSNKSWCRFDGNELLVEFDKYSNIMKTKSEYIQIFKELGHDNIKFANENFPYPHEKPNIDELKTYNQYNIDLDFQNIGTGSVVYDPNNDQLRITSEPDGKGQQSEITFEELQNINNTYFKYAITQELHQVEQMATEFFIDHILRFDDFEIRIDNYREINIVISKFGYLFERIHD